MALCVYSLLVRLATPFLLLRLWWRSRQEPDLWKNWRERLGYVDRPQRPVIWVHAVSVGETIAAGPLVKALQQRYPQQRILLTAMTLTGAERARAMFGDTVDYAYVPYDYPGAVRRFLAHVRPRALIVMETELWPNIIGRTHAAGVPIVIANARLSARSAEGYKKVSWLSRPLFRQLDWIAAQADSDARRFLEVGACEGAVNVTGSIKFDVSVSPEIKAKSALLREKLGPVSRPVWIAASTHEGEDVQLLAAHRQLLRQLPELLLILVPRHPERFQDVAGLVKDQGLTLARRSRQESAAEVQVYLGDTMGELLMLYGTASAAFIGGSLVRRGGHNPLEAATWALPVLSGPHVFNFSDIYQRLETGGGLVTVESSAALVEALTTLFRDDAHRAELGRSAEAVLLANQGALERLLAGVETKLERRRNGGERGSTAGAKGS